MERIEKVVFMAEDGTEWADEESCLKYEASTCPVVEGIIYLHADKSSQYENGRELGLTSEALDNYAYCAYEVSLTVKVNRLTGEAMCTAVNSSELINAVKL